MVGRLGERLHLGVQVSRGLSLFIDALVLVKREGRATTSSCNDELPQESDSKQRLLNAARVVATPRYDRYGTRYRMYDWTSRSTA